MASSYDGALTTAEDVVAVRSADGTKAATAEAKHAIVSKRIMVSMDLNCNVGPNDMISQLPNRIFYAAECDGIDDSDNFERISLDLQSLRRQRIVLRRMLSGFCATS